jgi:metal-sulfur cluster biosynthetic enzyme
MSLADFSKIAGEASMTGTSQPAYPFEGPPQLLAPIDLALQRVVDPEVAMNVVDVGLVYGVRVDDGVVNVDVTMTSPACPVADVIVTDIENELDRDLPADLRIRVRIVWEPPWSPDRMSDSAKAFMGW